MVALPMPALPPVTMMTLSASEGIEVEGLKLWTSSTSLKRCIFDITE
jgi:hypothetical protein